MEHHIKLVLSIADRHTIFPIIDAVLDGRIKPVARRG
jgi:hypothetical protein